MDCVGECECHSNALDDEDAGNIMKKLHIRHYSVITFELECYFEAYVGDGYCNDENNYQSCGFDGGDCCLEQVKTAFCYECLCLEDGGIQNSVAAPSMLLAFEFTLEIIDDLAFQLSVLTLLIKMMDFAMTIIMFLHVILMVETVVYIHGTGKSFA